MRDRGEPIYEAVDFEPDDDDLMDEEAAVDTEGSPTAMPAPRPRSAITGGAGNSSLPRKTKGRWFREELALRLKVTNTIIAPLMEVIEGFGSFIVENELK
ncbi:hypothetical protein HPP92_000388 [Vanilla planifolia]|uniref:Uncharacterized protein n=1 Tax=Vanilla planifolia TaxID=51239 RepID=A0A835VEC8_VANPL|nr:hypothetical protein HPP92_000388 [Vanilla planifolia]